MKTKLSVSKITGALMRTFKLFPVEIVISLYTFVYGVLVIEDVIVTSHTGKFMIPLFLALAMILNNLFRRRLCEANEKRRREELVTKRGAGCETHGGGECGDGEVKEKAAKGRAKGRILYYLCWLPMLPLWFVDLSSFVDSVYYPVTLLIMLLGVLVSRKACCDKQFVTDVLKYAFNFIVAWAFASLVFLLLIGIYYSVVFIFNLDTTHRFNEYALLFAYAVTCPLLFFSFTHYNLDRPFNSNRFIDILFNYILTPALIIYTLLLYAYFIKILVMWTLPEGMVAYMVFTFTLVGVFVMAVQPLLGRRLYDWFLNRFPLFAIPAVIVFWVGFGYRIWEYGLTQWRFYLLLCGVIMTFALVLLAVRKRKGNYMTITFFTMALFAVFTYIPPISAKSISYCSQEKRVRNIANSLGLLDENGRFIRELPENVVLDASFDRKINDIHESLRYLNFERVQKFGINDSYDIYSIYSLAESKSYNNDYSPNLYLYSSDFKTLDISGFRYMVGEIYNSPQNSDYYYSYDDERWLRLYKDDKKNSDSGEDVTENKAEPVLELDMKRMLTGKIAGLGLTGKTLSHDILEEHEVLFTRYDAENMTIILSYIELKEDSDNGYKIGYFRIKCLLLK